MTKRFDEMTPAEADQVFAGFLDQRPKALAYRRQRLAADGQDPDELLDGSVASLEPLWAWVKRQLPSGPRQEGWRTDTDQVVGQPVPGWYRHEIAEERALSADSVRLVDGVISYVGEVVMAAVAGARWRRGYHPVRRWVDQNSPVLAREDEQFGVIRMVFGMARRHVREPGSGPDRKLCDLVQGWINVLRQADPAPVEIEQPALNVALGAEVSVERGDVAGEWIVGLDDDVWVLVGDAAIERLGDALPGNVGVTEAEFEDREILIVRGRVDPDSLKRWVVAELTRSAGDSCP